MNNIIVLDDEPANIYLIEGLLLENGYEVTSFLDPFECLEYLENNSADVLLLDLMMPGISGHEVLDKLKADEKTKDIIVLMVTAKTDSKALEESFNKGAVDFIKKPYEEIELLSRLRVAIKLRENENNLKRLLKQRDDFVRIISHDLRTPMTTIHGFAELMLEDAKLPDKHKQSLQYIIDSSDYSHDYFNKLLSWALIESGDIKITPQKTSLKNLISSCLTLFTYKLEEKQLRIETDISEDLILEVDETYFKQVMNNLINNSIKYSESNKLISISLEKAENEYLLKITDQGIGIPEDKIQTFFKGALVKSSRGTSGEKGTGIGLYICYKILQAHSFAITCNSELGKGSTFSIHIATAKVHAAE
jgi:signal transduction histidine kinase